MNDEPSNSKNNAEMEAIVGQANQLANTTAYAAAMAETDWKDWTNCWPSNGYGPNGRIGGPTPPEGCRV